MRVFIGVCFTAVMCLLPLSAGFGQKLSTGEPEPKAIRNPAPEYGDNLKKYGQPGSVSVNVDIDKAGKVKVIGAFGPAAPCADPDSPEVEAIRKAAIEAAANSEFEPTLKKGKPVEVNIYLTYSFNPEHEVTAKQGGPMKPSVISGGILNGRARSLPKPYYPPSAGANRIGGMVTVQVLVSPSGEVINASAISGHPTLRQPAVEAACKAQFPPTLLSGNPVKVSGVLTYNFVR